MRIPGLKSLKLSLSWTRSRLVDNAIVLGYHRIVDKPQDPFSISVNPTFFAQHLEILHRYANPICLQDIVRALEEENIPDRAVAITFDDGYADSLYAAKPLLEQYEIPATVFIVTGNPGIEFWWDKLERIILSPEILPEQLCLTIDSKEYEWNLLDVEKDYKKNNTYGIRQNFLLSVYNCLKPLYFEAQTESLEKISRWTGEASDHDSNTRALSADEIIELAKGDLVEVGAHTVTHSVLDKLSKKEQQQEIQQSKFQLEKLLGKKVHSFSYPHGSISEDTLNIVRNSDFICACASFNDVVWRGSDLFKLPRFWVPDWDGATFYRWLKRWI
jgi:peptidoglycan/xylan/chitin deacetylase (PgdA/CDA1 family)